MQSYWCRHDPHAVMLNRRMVPTGSSATLEHIGIDQRRVQGYSRCRCSNVRRPKAGPSVKSSADIQPQFLQVGRLASPSGCNWAAIRFVFLIRQYNISIWVIVPIDLLRCNMICLCTPRIIVASILICSPSRSPPYVLFPLCNVLDS